MSPETAHTIGLWLIWVAAVTATPAALIYVVPFVGRFPWWRAWTGWALAVMMTSTALLLDLALLFRSWDGHLMFKMYAALAVYALIALAGVLALGMVVAAKVRQVRARR